MIVVPKRNWNQLENADPLRQLVEQAKAGCPDSFRELIEQNHRPVRLYLGKYIQCSAQVDDIAQEVFLVAFGQLSSFRNEAKFSTWLIGIARNKALEFLKAEKRKRDGQKQFVDAEIARQKIHRLKNQQSELEHAKQRLSAMQSCLDQLPHQSRKLIDRYYFDQQSANSIADESNISAGSVRMKLLRIRRILQKCIGAQDPDDIQPALEFDNE